MSDISTREQLLEALAIAMGVIERLGNDLNDTDAVSDMDEELVESINADIAYIRKILTGAEALQDVATEVKGQELRALWDSLPMYLPDRGREMSEMGIIAERLRKISQQVGRGYREAVFSVYAHLPQGQMYEDLARAADFIVLSSKAKPSQGDGNE